MKREIGDRDRAYARLQLIGILPVTLSFTINGFKVLAEDERKMKPEISTQHTHDSDHDNLITLPSNFLIKENDDFRDL